MKKLVYFLGIIALASCTLNKEKVASQNGMDDLPTTIEKIILVNHQKVTCVGSPTQTCLEIKELLDGIVPENWTYLYHKIQGFSYEAGYFYQIKIQETKLDPKKIPAGGSSVKRTLIEVMEKKSISIPPLYGTWKAILIAGADEKLVAKISPYIILKNGKLTGSDGCNTIVTSYKNDDKNILFNNIGGTKRGCNGDAAAIANPFRAKIESATSYYIFENNLSLFDKNGDLLIYFSKI